MTRELHPVAIVGAGPGDPLLLTLAAAEALASAEVVVYDRLVNEAVLERHVAPGCERIFAGKTPGAHAMSQEEINATLVAKAREGKRVVRLKGGDPFVFGRGGEEAQALARQGIPFRIVPGVSSAVAAAAYAGIPVTHRGLASSFAVVTGHEDPEKDERTVDWTRLATATDTIVVLMGTRALEEIASALIAGGRPPGTPAAVVASGTLPSQRVVAGRLAEIADLARQAGIANPAVTIVGEVAALRDELRWFDTGPLFGKRVLVTRTRQQASELSEMLRRAGAEPVELPTIELQPVVTDHRMRQVIERMLRAEYALHVFTSPNAVDIFFNRLFALGADARLLSGAVAAIGPGTAAALRRFGIVADLVPETYTAEGLLEAIERTGVPVRGERILLPRSAEGREELPAGLRKLGAAAVDDVHLYRPVVPAEPQGDALQRLREGGIDIVTFASSSSVRNLAAMLGGDVEPLRKVVVACIGPVTAKAAEEAGLRPAVVASEHTIEGLVRALGERLRAVAGVQ